MQTIPDTLDKDVMSQNQTHAHKNTHDALHVHIALGQHFLDY